MCKAKRTFKHEIQTECAPVLIFCKITCELQYIYSTSVNQTRKNKNNNNNNNNNNKLKVRFQMFYIRRCVFPWFLSPIGCFVWPFRVLGVEVEVKLQVQQSENKMCHPSGSNPWDMYTWAFLRKKDIRSWWVQHYISTQNKWFVFVPILSQTGVSSANGMNISILVNMTPVAQCWFFRWRQNTSITPWVYSVSVVPFLGSETQAFKALLYAIRSCLASKWECILYDWNPGWGVRSKICQASQESTPWLGEIWIQGISGSSSKSRGSKTMV